MGSIRSDMLTIDKPGLIKELIGDAEVKQGPIDLARYDRVIDATGVSKHICPLSVMILSPNAPNTG